MFINFELNGQSTIIGYDFPCENPNHVLCIIHGIGEHAGRYERMAKYLKEEGIACVAMDLPGHGKSAGTRGHAAPRNEVLKAADELIEYAQKEYEGVPIVFYGHSMGGNIALDYKARGSHNEVPVAYIVSAPWIELIRKVSKPLYFVMKMCSKIVPRMQISSGCHEEDLGNLDSVRPYKENPLVHDKITMLCAYEGFSIGKAIAEGTNETNGKAEQKPFLLMHGTGDKICSIEGTRKLAKRLKNAPYFTYVEWEGYYHEIHNGGPEATGEDVMEKILQFIKSN
ncbi:MAG: alpha/beta hydrolase [Anaerovoracaceae bacterium]